RTGADLQRTKIGHHGHYQHVSKDRRFRNARRMGPSVLEPKLCAKIYKAEGFLSQREFLHANKVVVILYLVFDLIFRFVDSIDEWGGVVDDLKFPVGGKIMCSFQYPFFEPCVVAVKEIFSEILPEISPQILDVFIYLLKHQDIDLPPFFAHQLMKDGGLDVSQYDPGEEFENSAFDQFQPVDLGMPFGFFELSEHIGE